MKFSPGHLAKVALGWDPEAIRVSETETSWLNGMRGLAAFSVMMYHYSGAWLTVYAEAPFGSLVLQDLSYIPALWFRAGTRLWAPWRLPILRLFVTDGGGQVALFFVISGFVLTWTFLNLADARQYNVLFKSLGSAVFRRWSRLYLPCIVVNFIYCIDRAIEDKRLQNVWAYPGEAITWINPFRTLDENKFSAIQTYNDVVWTIPYEFSGSIFVYVLVLMLGRFTYPRRLASMLVAVTCALFSLKWHLWLFGSGMILADYTRHSQLLFDRDHRQTSVTSNTLWSLCLVLGLVVLSFPLPQTTWYTRPGYDLEVYIPLPPGWRKDVGPERMFWGVGAIIVTTSITHLRLVQRFYELSVMQYLGKISFMLYLIHRIFQGHVGMALQNAAYAAFCTYDDDDVVANTKICHINSVLHVTILVGVYIVTVPLALLAANILERLVDRPITTLGKRIDQILLRQPALPPEQDMIATAPEPERELLLAEPVHGGDLELGVLERQS